MSAGNYFNPPSQSSQSQGQQQHLTRNNVSRLPFTPNINNYQHQDSSYERRILGQPTQSGRESAVRSLQNFDAQFSGAASGSSRSYGGYSGSGNGR